MRLTMAKSAKPPGDLVERLRAALRGHDVSEQRMFGGVCFMLNGNMVAGTLRNELLVRVGKEGNDAALRRPHARQMEMSRPAPGYVIVASPGTDRD
jgi:TfoX/Sxy family transcriptional regulator of competence genes